MNIFKSYTYTWRQLGIFKLALLAIGILIGSQWPEFFVDNVVVVVGVAVVATIYIIYISLKQ